MAYSGPVIDVRYEPDARDDMDSYQEICYEVGLDLEPNKYAKLRKAAMLAQEEQNDPLPCALLFVDQLFLKIRDSLSHKKGSGKLDHPVRRRIILEPGKKDVEIIVNQGDESERRTIQRQITFQHPDPYAIASAPDSNSPSKSQGQRPSPLSSPEQTPCANLQIRNFGTFSYPGKNPLNFGDYEIICEDLPYDRRRRNIMRNTVFMVNQAFCEDSFDGDFGQQLKKGLDELLIVKLWKKGATTEVKFKKLIEYIALSHFPHLSKEQLKLSDREFRGTNGRQRIALNPNIGCECLFEWMVDLAFRLGNVPLLDPPPHDFQEIPFYEWAGAPVYPEFEFQMFTTKGKTKTRLILKISPYTIADLRRLEKDEWCFLYNE